MSLYPLPSLILFKDFKGSWENYKQALYEVFLNSILGKLNFLNLPVNCRSLQPVNEMHRCFWHLISEGSLEDEKRTLDIRRCERIAWIAHLLNNYQSPELACWENRRGSNSNTILWLPPENYMIVLSRRGAYYLLTTAYMHDARKKKTNEKECEIYRDPRDRLRPPQRPRILFLR